MELLKDLNLSEHLKKETEADATTAGPEAAMSWPLRASLGHLDGTVIEKRGCPVE